MNFFRGEIVETGAEQTIVRLDSGEQVKVCNDTSSAKAGDKVTLGVRPQDALAEAEGENVITGTIKALERLGTESFVYLNHPAIEEDFILRTEDSRRREEGSEFKVGIPAESCHLFNETGLAFARTKAPHYD